MSSSERELGKREDFFYESGMGNIRGNIVVVLVTIFCIGGVGCSTVKSVVPGLQDEQSSGPKVGEKLHFKVTPEEALAILREVAPAHEWAVDVTGDQYDLQGFRGKYFRLLTQRFLGGVFEMNGVFFIEPEGTYVVVGSKETGFPQELVEPFTAAVAAKTEAAKD